MNARYAIYFIPEPKSPLALLGSALLGRDSESGKLLPQVQLPGFSRPHLYALTADARRYGLHATLKAPFYLKEDKTENDLLYLAASFVRGRQVIPIPGLALTLIGSFFALALSDKSPEDLEAVKRINALAADAVKFFDPLRAELSEQELLRREPQKLTERQRALLADWGYPFVFDEYRFHLTLTDKLRDSESACQMEACLEAYFATCFAPHFTKASNQEMVISSICVCKQIIPSPTSGANLRQASTDSAFMPIKRFGFQSLQ